jgi:hypothetical protein
MTGLGYLKNRFKKKDDSSDIAPSLKRDAQAEIGELFWSREANKLSFKKDINTFVRYDFSQTLVGPQGPIGPQGVPGPVGPAGLTWQGAWTSGASYVIDDAVGYNGASWFCIAPTSGTTAPDGDPTHWALLAAQGATGPQGPAGNAASGNSPEVLAYQVEDGLAVTGTTNLTICSSILIPANTLSTRELIEVVWSAKRVSGSSGAIFPYLYLNTSESIAGATQLAVGQLMFTQHQNVKIGRDLGIISGHGFISNNSFSYAVDYSPSGALTNFTFDTSVDNYLLFCVILGSPTDTATVNRIRVTRYSQD